MTAKKQMRVIIQNLQKREGLASELIEKLQPVDILLGQEINWFSEPIESFQHHSVEFVSRQGYGTVIYVASQKTSIKNIRQVKSPHAEFGGFIYKKTIIADYYYETSSSTTTDRRSVSNNANFITLVSFHGYNGQPMKNVQKLVDHVMAVVAVLEPDVPTIFAGDFNTWTKEHLNAVQDALKKVGFTHALSWSYPGRDFPLDHIFIRGNNSNNIQILNHTIYKCESDHQGCLLEISIT